MSLPPASKLPALTAAQKADALGLLFEPCDTLVALALPELSAGREWPEIIEAIRTRLHALAVTDPRVSQIVAAHPRLGAKKVDSAQSQAEQKSLGSSETEAAELRKWNGIYEDTFPGLRYVVFVAGRPRAQILVDMQRRVAEKNFDAEVRRAFDAMCDIALDREASFSGRSRM